MIGWLLISLFILWVIAFIRWVVANIRMSIITKGKMNLMELQLKHRMQDLEEKYGNANEMYPQPEEEIVWDEKEGMYLRIEKLMGRHRVIECWNGEYDGVVRKGIF